MLAYAACASACLDALDLWLALGAVAVGGETSADTAHMDGREAALPIGLDPIAIPMPVHRGRPRGHDQPYGPAHARDGDFADGADLVAWIATLPAPDATPATTSR